MTKNKKRLIGLIIVFIIGLAALEVFEVEGWTASTEIALNLQGDIYYTKRDGAILNLYTAKADFSNERLVYSHEGKGKGKFGNNDNIIDFYFELDDKSKDKISNNIIKNEISSFLSILKNI